MVDQQELVDSVDANQLDLSTDPMVAALVQRLDPIIRGLEAQLDILGKGQSMLSHQIANISREQRLTDAELSRVADTYARVPQYIAKVHAMKSTIASVHHLSAKLKRRSEQVQQGRIKQAERFQGQVAKEQAYDRSIAAVQSPSRPRSILEENMDEAPQQQHQYTPTTPTSALRQTATVARSAIATSASSISSLLSPLGKKMHSTIPAAVSLPFPRPPKPVLPQVSGNTPVSPGPMLPIVPIPLGGKSDSTLESIGGGETMTRTGSAGSNSRASIASSLGGTSTTSRPWTPTSVDEMTPELQQGVDRFPEVSESLLASEPVEVVRISRKKKKKPASIASVASVKSIKQQ